MEEQTIENAGLSDLRQKVKEAMIPLLIQIFHLKQAKLESETTSRLQTQTGSDDATEKLLKLQSDLQQLSLWTHSCLSQIEKALSVKPEAKKMRRAKLTTSSLKFSTLFRRREK